MAVKICGCNCKHEQQDSMYGKGNRVCNSTSDVPVKWRCTVCRTEHSN